MKWDVVYQGIYCLSITAPSEDEALQLAYTSLGVADNEPGVEVFEASV